MTAYLKAAKRQTTMSTGYKSIDGKSQVMKLMSGMVSERGLSENMSLSLTNKFSILQRPFCLPFCFKTSLANRALTTLCTQLISFLPGSWQAYRFLL